MFLAFRARALGAALAVTLMTLPATAVEADDSRASSGGPLDGMAFVGKIGPAEAPDRDDVLYFDDGHFWSAACTKCGFAPAVYWVRHVEGGIEFRGVLESPERGRFSYLGSVRDQRIEVSIQWQRERWYGAIDRELAFRGRLAKPDEASPNLQAARQQAAADSPDPNVCPS